MKLNKIKIGKFNILDIAIVLIVIIFIGVFAISHMQSNEDGTVVTGNSNVATKFTYTISISNLAETSPKMIEIGDEIYDKVSNTCIGKIVEIETTEALGLIEKENGEILEKSMPGRVDVNLKIETDGTIKNGEYLANGLIRIMVGNFREIKTKYLMCSGTISSIDRVEK